MANNNNKTTGSSSSVSSEKIYDVFISYRRDKSREIARLLQLALERKGLKIFFDLEEIRNWQFNTKLYDAIGQSKNVVFWEWGL